MKIDFITNKVPFTQVSNELLNDNTLTLKAKGLFAYLYSKPDEWDFSYERIANDHMESKGTILKILKELERGGYLVRKKLKTGRVSYFLTYEPNTKLQSQAQKPNTKNANQAKSQVGYSSTISNKEYISNKDNTSNKEELPEWLDKKAWEAWEEYRKEKRQKLTSKSIALQVKFLEKDIPNHVAIIEQSIQNGWTGLFPLKVNNVTNQVRVLKFK